MLTKPLAFEQDKNAIFLRNQEMHLHYTKLNSIRNRKNAYLPEISTKKRKIHRRNSAKENDYYIQRDNNLIFKKLDKIFKRPNQINFDSEIIDGYLSVKRNTRDKYRTLKKDSLMKENIKIKLRIDKIKPVIDNKQLNDEFKKSRKISCHLRKIHPNDSAYNIYLNENESKIIREYEKEQIECYLKEKRQREGGYYTGRKGISLSIDNNKTYPYSKNTGNNANTKKKVINIDKKILAKIRYV
jgi:hypothetical protein